MSKNEILSWNEYFMAMALLAAKRSKDPNTKVGACIVNEDKRIIGVGYNGMPNGNDKDFPWDREGDWLETKYPYVVHAEENAILNSIRSVKGACMYVSLFPCPECAKAIVQSGIKKVFYLSDKYRETEGNIATRKIFNKCGVEYIKIEMNKQIQLV